MAPHSSTLAWKIPWTEEPGGLQSMGSQRVGHSCATSLSLFTFMHWRRKWQATPVFLPGESQGRGSLVGCRLWGHTESDTTEVTQQQANSCIKHANNWMKLNQKPMFLIQSHEVEALCSVMDSFRQLRIIDYILGARDAKIIKASSCSGGCHSPVRMETRRH